MILSAFSDWPGFYLIGLLAAHYTLFKRKLILPLSLIFLGIQLFELWVFFTVFLDKKSTSVFLNQFLFRFGSENSTITFNLVKFPFVMGSRLAIFLTPFSILFILFWFRNKFKDLRSLKLEFRDSLIVVLFLMGLIHIILFRQGAFVHEFWQFYFLPSVSIMGALLIADRKRFINRKYWNLILTLALGLFAFSGILTSVYFNYISVSNARMDKLIIAGQKVNEVDSRKTLFLGHRNDALVYSFEYYLKRTFDIKDQNDTVGNLDPKKYSSAMMLLSNGYTKEDKVNLANMCKEENCYFIKSVNKNIVLVVIPSDAKVREIMENELLYKPEKLQENLSNLDDQLNFYYNSSKIKTFPPLFKTFLQEDLRFRL